ncbi:sensor histidine kinase (plasmid) [Streptomyces sp. BI20]|uniref:sensor histidine kinase n=1 Tax=Streptomyces sp. BI20 TaxID=3403460 RepID=UPI003C7890F2
MPVERRSLRPPRPFRAGPQLASVRVRVTVGAVLVVGLVLAATAAGFLVLTRAGLVRSAEETALKRAEAVAEQARTGGLLPTLSVPDGESNLLQVVADDGRVLAAGHQLIGRGPIAGFRPAPGRPHEARTLTPADTKTPDQRFRVVAVPTRVARGDTEVPAVVYAGTTLRTADEARRMTLAAVLPGIPLMLLLVGAVTWHSCARALRPVAAIRAELAEITEHDPRRRVPVPASRDEIADLARTANATLERLHTSLQRERRFVADASHELRNPIAALRAHIELASLHPDLLCLADLERDSARVQRLVTDLLLLARLDARESTPARTVDLAELVRTVTARRGPGRVPVRTELPPGPACLAGRPEQLARVLDNLLDNADRHAATRVDLALRRTPDGTLALTVTDDGEGVPAEHREAIFTRFTRLDPARARDTGGTGLGLAIAREIAGAHGGTLTAEPPPSDRAGGRFLLCLPAA